MNYTRQEIAAKIRRLKRWYHNIDLHGALTNPTNPSYPETRWQLIKPYVPQDLTGKTVLDVGCNAGYFSIKMKQRGASVVGVDWYVEGIEQARFVSDVLALDIEYICQNIYEFVINNTQTFDYVFFLGVFYHLRYPLLILDYLARITSERLYFQTIVTDASAKRDLLIPENLTMTSSMTPTSQRCALSNMTWKAPTTIGSYAIPAGFLPWCTALDSRTSREPAAIASSVIHQIVTQDRRSVTV